MRAADSATSSEKLGAAAPVGRRAAAQCLGEVRTRQLADEHPVQRQLADEDGAGHAGDVAFDVVAHVSALASFCPPVLDLVEVAVQQVNPHPVDGQPGAAVHQAAPLAGLDHGAGIAEGADGIGVDPPAVVKTEVPVAAGVLATRCARASEGDGHHAGNTSENRRKLFHAPRVEPVPGTRLESRSSKVGQPG